MIKYLCLSFPHNNGRFFQIFGGETAECVCQGLGDIFHHIGGVPRQIVFDNAHIELKNWTHVRKLIGWDRLETVS